MWWLHVTGGTVTHCKALFCGSIICSTVYRKSQMWFLNLSSEYEKLFDLFSLKCENKWVKHNHWVILPDFKFPMAGASSITLTIMLFVPKTVLIKQPASTKQLDLKASKKSLKKAELCILTINGMHSLLNMFRWQDWIHSIEFIKCQLCWSRGQAIKNWGFTDDRPRCCS